MLLLRVITLALPGLTLPGLILSGMILFGPILLGGPPSALAASPATDARPDLMQIVSPARPPYVFDDDGMGRGPAADLVRRIAEAAGIDPAVRILPFQRAIRALDSGNTLYPALLRTPQREPRYQWIGEVFDDRAVLFTRADTPVVADVAGARQLERISVMRGSELQALLQSFDLQNVESNIAESDNARLLQAGRIDGWFTLRTVGRATWQLLGFAARDLRAGEPFAQMSFWIAASHDLPAATVIRLRAAYDRLRKSGEYNRIVAPLRALPS
ncbi:substrate-binding periplasmic protein [Ferrovibrio xuzhouensis]|uniref:Substrate-binding periplasmic protein n=1 Tax=Ferrovibrio xuzhouensis TaxID=1576914 RepID=A0ABV7VGC0_9PROT